MARTIDADHADLIHDVAFDFYGRRLATCSSDQNVKIFDLQPDGDWKCTGNFKTHSGSVWKVTWAHPEFGQVIATCSYDRTAAIWEECPVLGKWLRKASIVCAQATLKDIKFAPKHLGLQIATCSEDCRVRVYEAPDVMNLSTWPLQGDIDCKMPLSCLTWHSNATPALIAVGSDDTSNPTAPKVHLYDYSETSRTWTRLESVCITDPVHDMAFAPNMGRSFDLIAVASNDVKLIALTRNPNKSPTLETRLIGEFSEHQNAVWRLSWNIFGTVLASSGNDGYVRLWKANYAQQWKCIVTVNGSGQQVDTESGFVHAGNSISYSNAALVKPIQAGSIHF
ncbi:nucleoporin SEH1-like isoform X2 [Varroa jacobsoni]|uniref:Uncharacterized protein n=2 Tax=Varroa TaxID=62624 RepID=A0A7M7K9S0_VARDE|nr:nucleoporin SEH1-like [Varroa destructor]XP_022663106.1 nucleoporin SEH1-like [Varroa destructor]XP_022663107.1 nucleoporin SEH1-like [Varroa destructor]XP_022663108.1 nucleoporin SEH1-like [Varroa destructor]XP_022663109.1 nucleoporin SEH1-like [Varroa destructor]XP_022663110.1 nucleoporin SEH1-like [Varroa destructor]XP_022695967.1 nucleoporin SEH1-like isoform X2 [Varroa jacobsoni]XP_022695968.1 nucleoporin SEH1-like isoform X2 [Varroa jacobsoni]XP_022695969.1 nucleoporin SEH1-like is